MCGIQEGERMQELEQQLDEIGSGILITTRNELYLHMRFMDVALSGFLYIRDEAVTNIGTDGWNLYYNVKDLGGMYRGSRVNVNRMYLHTVLHCIFRHIVKRDGRDANLWNLATDIVVESVIDQWKLRCLKKGMSWLRRETYSRLKEKMKVLTAEKVYRILEESQMSREDMIRLGEEFAVDDHRYWPKDDDQDKKSELNQKWQDISEEMQTDMETFSQEASADAGHLLGQIRVENKVRYDYREFLRKFAVLKEEMTVDDDTFDYVFYSYGLSMYGNMPLIEPQEWKEVSKVSEFVIIIDTSMSCSGETVRKFLEETYGILSEENSFFRKVNIHIIQCDDQVRTDQKITCKEELKHYMDNLELVGEGGTDFRPAFQYINDLIETGEFSSLRGVIYFTDGQGIFPRKMPPYKTAFVIMDEEDKEIEVPPWAIKITIEEEELDSYEY